jgi:tetratricopeptide (TPR) repeat protein
LLTEQEPGRFGFHDLLRAYAIELVHVSEAEAERRAATHRMLDHYLHTAFAAERKLRPVRTPIVLAASRPGVSIGQPDDYGHAMAWLAGEHPVLLRCVGHAAATGFDTHVWQLAWTMSTFLYRRNYGRDLASTARAALEATKRLGDRPAQARAHRVQASAHLQLGRFDDAHTQYEAALALETELGDRLAQASTHDALAVTCERLDRHVDALDHAQQALGLYRDVRNKAGQADALNIIGWCQARLGRYRQALDSCTDSLALYQEVGDRSGEAATWDSLGFAHHHLRQLDAAVGCYQHAIALYRELDAVHELATVLIHLGDTQRETENEAARSTWEQALSILEDLAHPDAENVRTRLADLGDPAI